MLYVKLYKILDFMHFDEFSFAALYLDIIIIDLKSEMGIKFKVHIYTKFIIFLTQKIGEVV